MPNLRAMRSALTLRQISTRAQLGLDLMCGAGRARQALEHAIGLSREQRRSAPAPRSAMRMSRNFADITIWVTSAPKRIGHAKQRLVARGVRRPRMREMHLERRELRMPVVRRARSNAIASTNS